MAADHPVAVAATRAGRNTESVLAADALGRAVDVRIAALASLDSTGDASRDEIRATLAELGRIAGHEEAGACPAFWSWYRGQLGAIRGEAARLFAGEAWVVDIRGPNWRP